jgi:hypothetical protein
MECNNHYLNFGIKENRLYNISDLPHDFDWKFYLSIYPDLEQAGINTEYSAIRHYLQFGQHEKRMYVSNELENFFSYKNNTHPNPKIEFRNFCNRHLNYIRQFHIPEIALNSYYEAVLVEFRCLPHLEFLIRNTILKLGSKWSYTIICGQLNYNYMVDICDNISPHIKVIKTIHTNLDHSRYSTFLASLDFWKLLAGEKILIYQEDSCIFQTNINDFLQSDYIGAPWPNNQFDNSKHVGNGGFSLRTKKCMIDVIETISIRDTQFNSSTIDHMKRTNQTIGPEDVYFTLNMIKYNIGVVADYNTASLFSSELIYNPDSLGGHNFWLSNLSWKELLYRKLFNICAISSDYGLKIGGGEVNLLHFAKYFIDRKKCIIFLFVDENIHTKRNTITQILGKKYLDFFIFFNYKDTKQFIGQVDYHFDMYNLKTPQVYGCAKNKKNNLFHCQFPMDTHKLCGENALNTYGQIILNSDYTKTFYEMYIKPYLTNQSIHIIYPTCFNRINIENYEKDENSFVLVGRIIDNNLYSNNKNFEIALKYFEKLSLSSNNNFTVSIIGSVYSENMLNKLKNFKIKNITIYTNADENTKLNIFKKSKYIINMVGTNRDKYSESYAYEHFGISILEGIHYKCIPISVDGGYPSYYINNETGILFHTEQEFEQILSDIIVNRKQYTYNCDFYNEFIKTFTFDHFCDSIDKIL